MAQARPSLEEKIGFLRSPAAYGGESAVEVKETRLSWLFLTASRVYKLKKPVRRPYLDFRSLAARERNARAEVRLNRRLAEEVYLGVSPLTLDPAGRLGLGGEGRAVDWLVEMRRLPSARMLDSLIRSGTVEHQHIEALAARLLAFYRDLPTAAIAPEAYRAHFSEEQALNAAVLRLPRHGLRGPKLTAILDGVQRVAARQTGLLDDRVAQGRIVEGHGDLRPEHVCCLAPTVVIDCLEFSRALRLVDPFDEITFLGLECALLGADWIGELLCRLMAPALGGLPPPALLNFYWCFRACLRARQALTHLHGPAPREPERWRPLAERYLALAETGIPWI